MYIKIKFPAQQSLYDNSFAVIAPRVWNKIAGHFHLLADIHDTEFKK